MPASAAAKRLPAKAVPRQGLAEAGAFFSENSLNYLAIFRAEPRQRIQIVKAGLPAISAKQIISDLDMRSADAAEALQAPISTINRKAKNHETLTRDESERFLGLAKLIGQVQAMVDDSGDPDGFDAKAWTARWLNEPLPAFGGDRPVDYMDTMEGQTLVANMLARIQSGAFA
jgi:putative toxin-antitoxin system antitoxin component (TIGR02293 family)